MTDQMTRFFMSAFNFPGLNPILALAATALGLGFGAIWLAAYRPPIPGNRWLWAVAMASALLTWTAIAFVQIPLQTWASQGLLHFWSIGTLTHWLLLAGIPSVLLSGLVQEGAKLIPTVVYWWRNQRRLDPKLGLILGAMAGAGFGVFEAVWVHNTIFASGWDLNTVQSSGLLALLGFWERFFSVGFHIGVSALAGYGLARGWGWQAYLVASLLHGITNYGVVLLQKGMLTTVQVEVYIAVFAIAITAAALWLRWRSATPRPSGSEQSA